MIGIITLTKKIVQVIIVPQNLVHDKHKPTSSDNIANKFST